MGEAFDKRSFKAKFPSNFGFCGGLQAFGWIAQLLRSTINKNEIKPIRINLIAVKLFFFVMILNFCFLKTRQRSGTFFFDSFTYVNESRLLHFSSNSA